MAQLARPALPTQQRLAAAPRELLRCVQHYDRSSPGLNGLGHALKKNLPKRVALRVIRLEQKPKLDKGIHYVFMATTEQNKGSSPNSSTS